MIPLPPVPSVAFAEPLRAAFLVAGYTASGVAGRLGPVAERALARGEPAAARRACSRRDALATLIRLFLLAEPVADVEAEKVLGSVGRPSGLLVDGADAGVVRAAVDVRPYGDGWWVASDLRRPGGDDPLDPEAVVGIGSASVTLAAAIPALGARTALDLGVGCGVQSLHLAGGGAQVTGTDLSERALDLAALTAALSGVELELVPGNLFEPVADRRFEQVVANPPFVIGPHRFTYRDSALPADGLTAAVVGDVVDHLTPGGVATMLGSWLVVRGSADGPGDGDWRERVGGWLPAGCDALVVLREQLDPAEHVALWLADGDEGGDAEAPGGLAEQWLDDLDQQEAVGVAYGLVVLRRLPDGAGHPTVSMLDLRHEPEPPSGARLLGWLQRLEQLRAVGLSGLRVAKAPGLRLIRSFTADDDGWEPAGVTLSAPGALPTTIEVGELVAALVKECEPELPLAAVVELVAAGTGNPHLPEDAMPTLQALVEAGLLVPVP